MERALCSLHLSLVQISVVETMRLGPALFDTVCTVDDSQSGQTVVFAHNDFPVGLNQEGVALAWLQAGKVAAGSLEHAGIAGYIGILGNIDCQIAVVEPLGIAGRVHKEAR